MDSIIQLEEAVKNYRRGAEEVRAIDGVNLSIARGEFIAVVGRSGSGKTTLLNLIGCVDRPTGGRVNVHGMETEDLTDNQLATIRSTTIGFVFQQFFLIPTLTATENVMLPGRFCARRDHNLESKAKRLLDLVGLSARADHLPRELSGGEMQRVAIARALINDPVILLADEPTGNLDTRSAGEIGAIIEELNENGLTVVVVTHSTEVSGNATRSLHLQDGRIVEEKQLRPTPVSLRQSESEPEPVSAPEYIPRPQKKLNWGTLTAVCSLFLLGAAMFSTAFLPFIGRLSGYRLTDWGLLTFSIHGQNNLTRTYTEKPLVLLTGTWPIVLGLILIAAGILLISGRRRSGGWLTVTVGLFAVAVAAFNLLMIEVRLGSEFSGAYGLWVLLAVGGTALVAGALLVLLLKPRPAAPGRAGGGS